MVKFKVIGAFSPNKLCTVIYEEKEKEEKRKKYVAGIFVSPFY